MRNKIAVIGSMNYDIILDVSRLPQKGETMAADGVTYTAGGKGANQAVQSAKLGIETYLVGCVGNDFMGDYLLKAATEFGVDTSFVKRKNQSTGMAAVHALNDGTVHATIIRGANYELTEADVEETRSILQECGMIVMQMEIPIQVLTYAIEVGKECGCQILLNAAPAMEIADSYLGMCDIVVVNEVEAAFYYKKTIDTIEGASREAEAIGKKYGNQWVFTLGALGAVVYDGSAAALIKAYQVKAIETTGAGDSYIGGIAYGLMKGKDLVEACRFATKCSALTVCHKGAQISMPTWKEVKEFEKTYQC